MIRYFHHLVLPFPLSGLFLLYPFLLCTVIAHSPVGERNTVSNLCTQKWKKGPAVLSVLYCFEQWGQTCLWWVGAWTEDWSRCICRLQEGVQPWGVSSIPMILKNRSRGSGLFNGFTSMETTWIQFIRNVRSVEAGSHFRWSRYRTYQSILKKAYRSEGYRLHEKLLGLFILFMKAACDEKDLRDAAGRESGSTVTEDIQAVKDYFCSNSKNVSLRMGWQPGFILINTTAWRYSRIFTVVLSTRIFRQHSNNSNDKLDCPAA